MTPNTIAKTYKVQGMDCAHCAEKLQKGVGQLAGVQQVQVDFATGKLHLTGDVPTTALNQRVKSLGYELVEHEAAAPPQPMSRGGVVGFWNYLLSRQATQLALIGGGLILVAVLLILIGLPTIITDGLLIGAMAIAVYPIARSGLNTLLINRDFNINLLMTIAAVGAVILGEYLESATVIFLFAVGEALEGYTTDRARQSIRRLLDLTPPQAIRTLGILEEIVPVEQLHIGDVILVKPGERVAMDGEVISGTSHINQAPITGESVPVFKEVGAEVFAGTVNSEGLLHVRVTRLAKDDTLRRIIQLVEEAQSVRAPSQRLIDQFARWYTPAVVILAVLVASVPPLLLGEPFWEGPDGGHGWFYRALSLLVISCPCALVISAPVTIISAITAAARQGVLIKGGAHLEALGRVKAVAFDKTGTLTHGRPTVMLARSVDCATGVDCELCDDVLALAAAVEKRSTHPLAKAVINAAEQRGLVNAYAPAENVATLAGRGVQGEVNHQLVTLGNHRLFDEQFAHAPEFCATVQSAEAAGQTTMLLSDGERVRGFIGVTDAVRPESQKTIEDLNGLGITTVMLTGDNAIVAQAVGQQVGIKEIRANLLPADKATAVHELLETYEQVAMIGDGINDAPALATATVGIAMGGAGSAQAMETADVVLMGDELSKLPLALRLSKFARRLITENVALSFSTKFVFMGLAVFGGTSLWAAIAADVGVSLLVTLNGMRPLRLSRPIPT